MYDRLEGKGIQESAAVSAVCSQALTIFLTPLLVWLDARIDKRLVRTFVGTVAAIVMLRHNRLGLLLSELGGYILTPVQAPAGTKRLSNLLRSGKWHYGLIEQFLWQQGNLRREELAEEGQEAIVVWDESVLEKPESIALEGLCAVRSSKAHRLKRIKPGYYNPPGGRPIFVPGMNWVGLLIMGYAGPPVLTVMRWWSTRGKNMSSKRIEEEKLLRQCARKWGRSVLHVWDRGFAGAPWLAKALGYRVRFVMRWRKNYKLVDEKGTSRKAWEICHGKRSLKSFMIQDARRGCMRKIGVYMSPVRHPDFSAPLWLVVSRQGQGRTPWYLLTNEPIQDAEQAWQLILAYARRWQVEMAWRYSKSELAMESPRLWSWRNRLKLLLIASLAYAFLLSCLDTSALALRTWLLKCWCHRTGKRCREASTPLYRLRSALSRLWLAYPPPPILLPTENPG